MYCNECGDALGVMSYCNQCYKNLKTENESMHNLLDMQWKRTKEADQLWRDAHPGKEGVTPDLGELVGWLVAEREGLILLIQSFLSQG